MARLKFNFLNGHLAQPLAIGGNTMTSAGLTYMPVVNPPDYAVIAFDPERIYGEPEICYITSHSAGSTTATISRHRVGTTARTHSVKTPWVHGPLAEDFPDVDPEDIEGNVEELYIQDTAPGSVPAPYIWIQTGLGSGDGFTFWFEDGL